MDLWSEAELKLSPELKRQLLGLSGGISPDVFKFGPLAADLIKVMVKACHSPPRDDFVQAIAQHYSAVEVPYISDHTPYFQLILPKVNVVPLASEPCVLQVWHVPEIGLQGGVQDIAPEDAIAAVNLDKVHAQGHRGKGVAVFILDSGIDTQNKALMAHVKGAESVVNLDGDVRDELGHGSSVASLLATAAPEADLYVVKVFRTDEGDVASAMQAMETSAMKLAKSGQRGVVNISWGADDYPPLDDLLTTLSQTYQGIHWVVAGGNTGPEPNTITSPARSPAAVSVGAIAVHWPAFGAVADFSARGPVGSNFAPMVCAPGGTEQEGILLPAPGGAGVSMRGTSFSAPIVSGAMACLAFLGDKALPQVYATAFPHGNQNECGHGILDAQAALTGASPGLHEPPLVPVAAPASKVSMPAIAILLSVSALGLAAFASLPRRNHGHAPR